MLLGIAHREAVKDGMRRGGEYQYLCLLNECLEKERLDPTPRQDRTGTGTYGVFGRQMSFDLSQGFPLLTTKKLFSRGIIAELLWMLSGETNIGPLLDQGVHIWDEWADEEGNLGPVYGAQWRSWPSRNRSFAQGGTPIDHAPIDQITQLLFDIRNRPYDRGHVVTAWNPGQLDQMALRPCHCLFQVNIEAGKLNLQLYQRSADIFLGVPFNLASYALLTILLARETGYEPGIFTHTFGDLHLYANHVEQAREQITRVPKLLPRLRISNDGPMLKLKTDDIKVVEYESHPALKGAVSV